MNKHVFKAIADPTRREILRLLRKKRMTAGDIAEHFEASKPTLSHHFSILKEADLLYSRKDGTVIWYSLNTSVVEDIAAWAAGLAGVNSDEVNHDK